MEQDRTKIEFPFWVTSTDAIISNGYSDAKIFRQRNGGKIQRADINSTWRNNQSSGASESITIIVPRTNDSSIKIRDGYEFKQEFLDSPADLVAALDPQPNIQHVALSKLCNKKGKSERGYTQW